MYGGYYLSDNANLELKGLCERLWFHFFKQPLDELDHDWTKVLQQIRQFFFACEWYEVYDFVEFVAINYKLAGFKDGFMKSCDAVLEREASAYRFVGGVIAPIADREQLEEIERALERERGHVRTHLLRALELLSDRTAPDYRNSIKEAISAVESLVAKVIGTDKGTLGQLLKRLDDKVCLHPALRNAFSSLYGYTSDGGGIRHALMESEVVSFDDAKFFLVVCSAFVNFVDGKISSAG
jgi:hypothetical protein